LQIYLDVCCRNRPFDDQTQERIRLEAEAVLLILDSVHNRDWVWHTSDVVIDEIHQTPDPARSLRVKDLNAHANNVHHITEADIIRASALAKHGFSSMDALHIACAESCRVDVLLTTDDKMVRRAGLLTDKLPVEVENPLQWLMRIQESGHDN
jgi:predicted nucleic acid-binding protein